MNSQYLLVSKLISSSIRHIFLLGWVMQLACFVYIKRCWLMDKKIIENYAKYVSELSYKHSLLVFPEGTDFTESTKRSSDNYAQRNGLQVDNKSDSLLNSFETNWQSNYVPGMFRKYCNCLSRSLKYVNSPGGYAENIIWFIKTSTELYFFEINIKFIQSNL